MTNQHPLTPPQELRDKWLNEAPNTSVYDYLIDSAAHWGADQELEAGCEWVRSMFGVHPTWADELLADRRPTPPSLKEQALALLDRSNTHGSLLREEEYRISVANAETIRRALEALDD